MIAAPLLQLAGGVTADPRHPPATELVRDRLGVVYRNLVDEATCARWAAGALSSRASWTHNFDGIQATLGRAYYTHLETDREAEYFDGAAESDERVEVVVPGMQDALLGLVKRLVRGEVRRRPDWCGPGVHVFPAGGLCAQTGGDVHFDTEGLTEEQAAREIPALTLVLMLQAPREGGALRLWDRRFAGSYDDEYADLDLAFADALMRPGDVTVLECYRLHQIQPFAGGLDRVSATVHALRADDGVWEAWF